MSEASWTRDDGLAVPIDEKGYLLDWSLWQPELTRQMADADNVELTEDHWTMISVYREYFEKFDIEPPMRLLVKQAAEKLGGEKGNSRYLYRLFPDGPGTQGCRYAGLPRPVSCI